MRDTYFERNPNYGTGVFWRRIRLENGPGNTVAELEDLVHAMRCRISHADGIVTGVDSEMLRFPMTSCAGAGSALESVVGMPIDMPVREFYGAGRAPANCTHLFDLAWLAMRHANRAQSTRSYEATVPDQVDGRTSIRLYRDDVAILEWEVSAGVIVTPGRFEGVSLVNRFVSWARDTLSGEQLEAALVMHKVFFVAGAQRYKIDRNSPPPATDPSRRGACFGFGAERFASARRLGSRRAFGHPTEMLQFGPPPWR